MQNEKESLKQERRQALFDAEFQREDVRTALFNMSVWNANDNQIIQQLLKDGANGATVQEFVRSKASQLHQKEKREDGKKEKMIKKKKEEEVFVEKPTNEDEFETQKSIEQEDRKEAIQDEPEVQPNEDTKQDPSP